MNKRFTALLLCSLIAMGAMAQKPTALIKKASVAPEIDGVIDDVWAEAPFNDIDKTYLDDVPTLGVPGATTWQGLWTFEGIWILLIVDDDDFFPFYHVDPPGFTWAYDKPELYFDINDVKEDGGAPLPDEVGGGNGHYQIPPPFTDGSNNGTKITLDNGVEYAFMVNDPDYIAEYFVPFQFLVNGDGGPIDMLGEVGFDVYIVDRDEGDAGERIAVWANEGAINSAWNNMDDCGIITFDEAVAPVYITAINLTGGAITENNGTFQVIAEVLPENANEGLKWSIAEGADGGRATIDKRTGEITAILDGTVTVTCESASSVIVEQVDVTISNQLVSLSDVNLIRNPNFDDVEPDGTASEYGGWGGDNNTPLPQVIDGVAVCTPELSTEVWQYSLSQSGLQAKPDIEYIYSFVAWAEGPRTFNTDFEDTGDIGYNRYGSTTDPRNTNGDGRSDWTFDITDTPTRYTFDVIFDEITETTVQTVTFQLALSDIVTSIDSLVLVSVADAALIEEYVPVDQINVTGADGATTVSLGGMLQMSAEVLPAGADYKDVKWSVVPGTGFATIDEAGILTGDSSGTVTVVASAVDDSYVTGELAVFVSFPESISGNMINTLQIYPNPAVDELNVTLNRQNSTVSIFSSVGVKMDEVLVTGAEYKFDISHYPAGIYFIRAGNAVARFIK